MNRENTPLAGIYIFSITYVGLVTSSSIPNARARARAKAVFPAPKLPERVTIVAPFSFGVRRAANSPANFPNSSILTERDRMCKVYPVRQTDTISEVTFGQVDLPYHPERDLPTYYGMRYIRPK